MTKVAVGVSCNHQFLQQAVNWGAQLCIFHHGLDDRTDHGHYPLYTQKRLRLIFKHDLSILGYHYALDAHPRLGNNAQIITKLGGKITDTLYEDWGFVAKLSKPVTLDELSQSCQQLFAKDIHLFGSTSTEIDTIGVVSGAAKPYASHIKELQAKGVQAYISGETSESTPHRLIESNIPYLVCGHYATETFGVKALAQVIDNQFDQQLEVQFIDIPNSI